MKIFLDTNIIFKTIKVFQENNNNLKNSFLVYNKITFRYIFSEYGVIELIRSMKTKWLDNTPKAIWTFFRYIWLEIISSETKNREKYKKYVLDPNDIQILSDTINSWTNMLITNNTKDFKIKKIRKELKINILSLSEFICMYYSQKK